MKDIKSYSPDFLVNYAGEEMLSHPLLVNNENPKSPQ